MAGNFARYALNDVPLESVIDSTWTVIQLNSYETTFSMKRITRESVKVFKKLNGQ